MGLSYRSTFVSRAFALTLCLVNGITATVSAAEPEGFDLEKEAKALRLKKHELPGVEGAQFAALKGKIKTNQARLILPGLQVTRPVAVTVQSTEPTQALELQLVKTRWQKPLARCTTDESGRCTLKFRTQGDLGIVIQQIGSDSPSFIVDAIIGPKVIVPPSRSIIVPRSMDEVQGTRGFPLWILAPVVLAVGVAVWWWRRKRSMTTTALVFISVVSLGFTAPPASAEPVPGGPPIYSDELSFDQLMEQLNQMGDAGEDLRGRMKDIEGLGDLAESLSDVFERFGKIADGLEHLQTMLGHYDHLSPSDSQYQPDLDERSLPDIPSVCAATPACQACFSKAHEKFIGDRLLLEELRIIYSSTKDFSKAALSFGDSASGVHGVSGLAWQSERRKIEKSLKNMDDAYDRKFEELIDRSHESLMAIARCEDEYGIKDWYNHFGFMYFDFLKTKYKRPGN